MEFEDGENDEVNFEQQESLKGKVEKIKTEILGNYREPCLNILGFLRSFSLRL